LSFLIVVLFGLVRGQRREAVVAPLRQRDERSGVG